ncbi:MAG: hypothetical protein IJY71_04720 [Clostridia bacterium]|nr:hypothetical protein [Clostridia bacterium]
MAKKLTVFGFTDVHSQQAQLDYPTRVRRSAYLAVEDALAAFGPADLSLCGGDNLSDYPYWERSCGLPKKNFLDIKEKYVRCFAPSAKGERVLYVAGNNDMYIGDAPVGEEPYSTTEFYLTGPMNETLGTLPESEAFFVRCDKKPAELPYLDAFHYVVDGVDFIGINIDPNTAFNSHEGYYTDETVDWVARKLDEIDPDGYKPVFLVGHLSAWFYYGGTDLKETMINGDVARFYSALEGHHNLFYLYGHMHGEDCMYRDSSSAVLHIVKQEDGSFLPYDNNQGQKDSLRLPDYAFSLVHMGGLRPFAAENFEEDGIWGYGGEEEYKLFPKTATPKFAQYLVMEVEEDKVTFHIRNVGSLEGFAMGKDVPAPYTVYLRRPAEGAAL